MIGLDGIFESIRILPCLFLSVHRSRDEEDILEKHGICQMFSKNLNIFLVPMVEPSGRIFERTVNEIVHFSDLIIREVAIKILNQLWIICKVCFYSCPRMSQNPSSFISRGGINRNFGILSLRGSEGIKRGKIIALPIDKRLVKRKKEKYK